MTCSAPFSSAHNDHCMSVSVDPGDTMLQRILYSASSRPRHFVNITAAAFEDAYAAIDVLGTPAAFDPTVTIEPDLRSIIYLLTEREALNTPVEFTENVASHSSSLSEWISPGRRTPATFTKISIGPPFHVRCAP